MGGIVSSHRLYGVVQEQANQIQTKDQEIKKLQQLSEEAAVKCKELEEQLAKYRAQSAFDKQIQEAEAGKAALKIQKNFRGHVVHKKYVEKKEREGHGTTVHDTVFKLDRRPYRADDGGEKDVLAFRKTDGLSVYGLAQPLLKDFRTVLQQVRQDGASRAVWVNLRQEPVIYVHENPLTQRKRGHLNEYIDYSNLSGNAFVTFEENLKKELHEQIDESSGEFFYWRQKDGIKDNEELSVKADEASIQTLQNIYWSLQQEGHDIQFARVPIHDENAPEEEHLDELVALLKDKRPDTAVIFNCQTGRSRTTTAMVIAGLLQKVKAEFGGKPSVDGVVEFDVERSRHPNYQKGEYRVIRDLVRRIPFGERIKQIVDECIDANSSVIHLRECILEYKMKSDKETKRGRRAFFLNRGFNYLERYFYLLVFAAYCVEEAGPNFKKTFRRWMKEHPEFYRMLDEDIELTGRMDADQPIVAGNIFKFDHFPGIHKLPRLSDNTPNFRQVKGIPVFGVAQVMQPGFKEVLTQVFKAGDIKKVIWVNLREEPVIYVKGRPYTMRHKGRVNENIEVPGVDGDELTTMERQLKIELLERLAGDAGMFHYWDEKEMFQNVELSDMVLPQEVVTLEDVYQGLMEADGIDVQYQRIPIVDETAPKEKDFDELMALIIKNMSPSTAFIFNCQMGRGRTTTAMVMATVLWTVFNEPDTVTNTVVEMIPKETDYKRGFYKAIRDLMTPYPTAGLAKSLLDGCIDKCSAMQNLREAILECVMKTTTETKQDQKAFWTKRGINYLERYFYLIMWTAYLLERTAQLQLQVDSSAQGSSDLPRGSNTKLDALSIAASAPSAKSPLGRISFSRWMEAKTDLYELLDNLTFEEQPESAVAQSQIRYRWRARRDSLLMRT